LMHNGRIVADGNPVDVLHEGHIAYVYGIQVKTFTNPFGQWDYDTHQ
jgi:ABC-type hemin transport system ATPase subunit